jgi:hypothetical protein
LSSWFIASFDCQVHAGESTRPSSSSRVPDASALMLRLRLLPTYSTCPSLCLPRGTYGGRVCR